MEKEYTLHELSKEFGVTKDLIKYHRRQLPVSEVRKTEQGYVMISERGKEIIRGKLRKEKYKQSFEESVLDSLKRIEWILDLGGHQPKPKSISNRLQEKGLSVGIPNDESKESIFELQTKLTRLENKYSHLVQQIESLSAQSTFESDGSVRTNLPAFKELLRAYPKGLTDYE